MLCIDALISGPCVVVPAVSKFVQIPKKHDLLCIAWQFSVESLPKGDRSLIRKRQEILKQIWKLTFELGVLTGTDPSVRRDFRLSIIINSSSPNYRENSSTSNFDWVGGASKTCSSKAILFLQFWFWPQSKSARVTFPCSRDLRAASVVIKDFHPNMVEVSKFLRSFMSDKTMAFSKCEYNI